MHKVMALGVECEAVRISRILTAEEDIFLGNGTTKLKMSGHLRQLNYSKKFEKKFKKKCFSAKIAKISTNLI